MGTFNRRGRRGTQRKTGLDLFLRTSAPSAVELMPAQIRFHWPVRIAHCALTRGKNDWRKTSLWDYAQCAIGDKLC